MNDPRRRQLYLALPHRFEGLRNAVVKNTISLIVPSLFKEA